VPRSAQPEALRKSIQAGRDWEALPRLAGTLEHCPGLAGTRSTAPGWRALGVTATRLAWRVVVCAGKLVSEKLAARGAELEARGLVRRSEASKEALGGAAPKGVPGRASRPGERGAGAGPGTAARAVVTVASVPSLREMEPGFDPTSGKRPELLL